MTVVKLLRYQEIPPSGRMCSKTSANGRLAELQWARDHLCILIYRGTLATIPAWQQHDGQLAAHEH